MVNHPNRSPHMTSAHFKLIASVLRQADLSTASRDLLIADFAEALRSTNPDFRIDKFAEACEPAFARRA